MYPDESTPTYIPFSSFRIKVAGKTLIQFWQKSKPFNFDRFWWVSIAGFDGFRQISTGFDFDACRNLWGLSSNLNVNKSTRCLLKIRNQPTEYIQIEIEILLLFINLEMIMVDQCNMVIYRVLLLHKADENHISLLKYAKYVLVCSYLSI